MLSHNALNKLLDNLLDVKTRLGENAFKFRITVKISEDYFVRILQENPIISALDAFDTINKRICDHEYIIVPNQKESYIFEITCSNGSWVMRFPIEGPLKPTSLHTFLDKTLGESPCQMLLV